MNKKYIIVIILQFVVILILGVILFKQEYNADFIKVSKDFLKEEIKSKQISILKMGNLIEKVDKNFIEKADKNFNSSYQYIPPSHPRMLFRIYHEALSVLNLIEELEKEIEQNKDINVKKIIDFSENNYFYIDEKLMSMIKLLENPNYGKQEKQYILLLIKNYYLQECISLFNDGSIPLAYGRVINYAERDTVNFGEIYQSQILFNAIDATGNIIIFENGDTIRYGKFEEKATKRGHNNKKGYMEISHREGTLIYEVNIDYYVK